MNNYTSGDVIKKFDISRQTVRQYSAEFAYYLSPGANPEKGRQRNFTETDLEVFALIVEMKSTGATYEDIHASLKAGQRGSIPLENPPARVDNDGITLLRRDLNQALAERDESRAELLRMQGENRYLKQQVIHKDEEIARLNRELGRLMDDTD